MTVNANGGPHTVLAGRGLQCLLRLGFWFVALEEALPSILLSPVSNKPDIEPSTQAISTYLEFRMAIAASSVAVKRRGYAPHFAVGNKPAFVVKMYA